MINSSRPMVSCQNLVKIYKVANLEIVALQGLDLTVPAGEILGIVGTSGSGKSTLMNILGGLDKPSAGCVIVDGMDLLSLSPSEMTRYQREKVGFVWQQTSRNLVPYLTAQENVELPMTFGWVKSRREKREWSNKLLESVGLYERRHHKLTQLSGGEQQRIAIAVALANKPVLLLGDEPTGEVDSVTARRVMETFHRLNEEFKLTTIIVTHDPKIMEQVDRVVAIRDGKTSTEMIRQVDQLEHVMAGSRANDRQVEGDILSDFRMSSFQEFVVLDSAGRLQIPREILDRLGIKRRARLEVEGNQVLIQPDVDEKESMEKKPLSIEEQISLLFNETPPKPSNGFWKRLTRRNNRQGR